MPMTYVDAHAAIAELLDALDALSQPETDEVRLIDRARRYANAEMTLINALTGGTS